MIAEIIINSNVKNLNKTFDYNIPYELQNKVKIGSRVFVKFGNIKKLEEGFVIGIKDSSEFKVKDIVAIVDLMNRVRKNEGIDIRRRNKTC